MAVLLWYNVSTKRDLTKETFRTIGSQAISGKVQCFQVSEWTSVCSQFLFVVQTELEFSNFATNIFIVQRSVSSVKRNVTLKLKRHRKNTNNRSLKLSLSLSLTHTHTQHNTNTNTFFSGINPVFSDCLPQSGSYYIYHQV